jgi:hypothetical protein
MGVSSFKKLLPKFPSYLLGGLQRRSVALIPNVPQKKALRRLDEVLHG